MPIVLILIFIACKIPHLYYPFYWDESWVYAPAIDQVYHHGPSLLPDAASPEYSRGHPLLFQAACALWMKVFGASHVAMHSFALFLSVLLAIAVFRIIRQLTGDATAITALLLLLLHADFFVSSACLLTDVATGLFALLALWYYSRDRYIPAALTLTCLFFTKESGLVAAVVLGIDILCGLLIRKEDSKKFLLRSATLAVPLALIALFFIVQKSMLGWYLYPGHTSIINISWSNTMQHLLLSLEVIFCSQGAWCVYALAGLLAIIAAVRTRRWLWLLVPLVGAALYAGTLYLSHKDGVFFPFLAGLVGLIVFLVVGKTKAFTPQQLRFPRLALGFAVVFTYFCCINFFEDRYLFPSSLMISVVLLSMLFSAMTQAARIRPVYFHAAILIAGVAVLLSSPPVFSIFERMRVQQELVDYMEKSGYYSKRIYTTAWLQRVHLQHRETGFLRSSREFTNVTDQYDKTAELYIFDNIEPDANYTAILQEQQLQLIHRYQQGNAWVAVYQRR